MPTKSRRSGTEDSDHAVTSLRIPVGLLAEFRAAAGAEERSMNAQMRLLITRYVNERKAQAA